MKQRQKNYKFDWNARVPMRDGVFLSANVYRPNNTVTLPAIVSITPYGADSMHSRGAYFAKHGYIYVAIDARGRGNSEGNFTGEENGLDGSDTIEWVAKQTWSNGEVVMGGASFLGGIQWQTLKEQPQGLKTIVPGAATYMGTVAPFIKNIFFMEELQWWVSVSGKIPNDNIASDSEFWEEKYTELYTRGLPYKMLDEIAGVHSEYFQSMLKRPMVGIHHDTKNFSKDNYQNIDIPILTITGYYDDTQTAALKHHKMHSRHGLRQSIEKHFVLIGPWNHSGVSTPKRSVGGLCFGANSLVDMNKLHKEWYDWILKNDPKPALLKKRITYYVVGPNEWKNVDSFEEIPSSPNCFFLNSEQGQANGVFQSGSMQNEKPDSLAHDTYYYDPLRLDNLLSGRDQNDNYLIDQTFVQSLTNDGLVYHSQIFEKDTEITGFVKAELWMAIDVPDTDFQITLYEVTPDGVQIRLSQDFIRARYRKSNRHAELINSGEVNKYTFDEFAFFSRVVSKGSRLRVVISSPNSWFFERNYNGGGVVAEETSMDARIAEVKIYHGGKYPSFIQVPIV